MPSCAKLQACLQQLKHYWPGRCAATYSDDLPLLEDRNVSQCITMSYNVEMCRCWIWTVRRARFWVTAGGAKCPALRVSTKVDDWFVVFSGLLNINLRMIIDIICICIYYWSLISCYSWNWRSWMERQSSAAPTSICDFSQRSLKRLRKPVSLTQFTKAPPLTPPVLQNITKGLARVLGRIPW